MLWYVTQQVPAPNCLSGVCPMVSALVPQVYLPQGYSGIEPGGSIVASKSLELLADSPIRNTGTLSEQLAALTLGIGIKADVTRPSTAATLTGC